MGLLDTLHGLGTKLKIIQSAAPAAPQTEPPKMATKTVSLSELTTEVHTEEVRALAELPAELSVPFEKVYQVAGVKPAAHGWTIERLKQLLRTEQFQTMERLSAQKALLGLLAAEKAEVEDLVKDAVARDQALDAFQNYVRKKMDDRIAARERKTGDLEAQIKDLQDQSAKLRDENKTDHAQWLQWLNSKRAQERELAWAIGYLLDKPVVTLEEDAKNV